MDPFYEHFKSIMEREGDTEYIVFLRSGAHHRGTVLNVTNQLLVLEPVGRHQPHAVIRLSDVSAFSRWL